MYVCVYFIFMCVCVCPGAISLSTQSGWSDVTLGAPPLGGFSLTSVFPGIPEEGCSTAMCIFWLESRHKAQVSIIQD